MSAADDVHEHDDVRDELPADLDVSAFVGPYVFPNNSRRRVPGVLYLVIAAGLVVLWALGGDSPLVNDFTGSEATRNIDASVKYQFNDNLSFSLEGLNLTNQTEDRWAYQNEPLVTQYSSTGRQIFAGFRLIY